MRSIKITMAFLFCALVMSINTRSQNISDYKIDIDLKHATLSEAFSKIESLTKFRFSYKTEDLEEFKEINYHQRNVTVKKMLADILANTSLQFEQTGQHIIIKKISKTKTITGPEESAKPQYGNLQPVIVAAANKNIIKNVMAGVHHLDAAELKKIPMAGGEPDVLKSLQFLPGIQTSNEGTTNLSVRGGSYDQNLVLLDDAPVYNPTHSLGFFSAFNTDAIKDVSIYKGVFPTQYGGRLSSVIDVQMKQGNPDEQVLSGGIGLLASRLSWEGPIKYGHSDFMISGRYSDLGELLNLLNTFKFAHFPAKNNQVAFYDLNGKLSTILGKKDRLYLSGYTGHDNFFVDLIDGSNKMNWSNSTFTLRWNHVFNSRFVANTSLLYSNYNYLTSSVNSNTGYAWKGKLREATLKTDMDYNIASRTFLKFGVGITAQDISPATVLPTDTGSTAKHVSLNNRSSAQAFAYLGGEQKISKAISLSIGLRATAFAALGDATVYRYNADKTVITDSTYYGKGKIIKSYFGAEPRAMARILLSDETSLKLSYGRNYQFQHLLSNSSVGLPNDIWLPSDIYFKPQYSDQFAAGIYKTFKDGAYETSIEGYYRKSYNILDFKDNAEIFLNDKIETQILTGIGKGYGLEFMLKKNKGLNTGWVSYTWSKSLRQIDGINNNEWYPANYDHRHNLSVVYNRIINKRWSISANFVYRSGGHITIPLGSYVINGNRFLYYSSRNGYTLPAYHRLDLSATLQGKHNDNRKWKGEWVFSIYNAYSRKNIFSLYTRQMQYDYTNIKTSMVYLVGILPSVTYNFKF